MPGAGEGEGVRPMTEEALQTLRKEVSLARENINPLICLHTTDAASLLATLDSRTARIGALEGLLRRVRDEWIDLSTARGLEDDIDAALKEKP